MSRMPVGSDWFIRSTSWRTAFDRSSGLATACLITPILSELLPLKREIVRSSIAPITALPTSRTRTG